MFFTRHKTTLLEPEQVLPGRETPLPVPDAPRRPGHPAAAAVPRRLRDRRVRPRLLLGRRARVLAGARRVHDRRRLRGRPDAEPDLRGGVLRAHQPHRGRARRLRPRRDLLRGDAEAVLGEPRPDPGHAPGQRRRHPVPLGDLRHHAGAARGRARRRARPSRRSSADSGYGEITPRSPRPARSTTPRPTTSSTWPRTRTATAGSAAPASPARSAPGSPAPERRHLLAGARRTPSAGRGGARASPRAWRS